LQQEKVSGGEILEEDIKFTKQNDLLRIKRIALIGKNGPSNDFGLNEKILLQIDYEVLEDTKVFPSIHVLDKYGGMYFSFHKF
jgi:lipopolysaccharide transport system ATP-binding protein